MAQRGEKLSKEYKQRISASKKGKSNHWLGRRHTETSKQKMSEYRKGRSKPLFTQEHKQRLSVAARNRMLRDGQPWTMTKPHKLFIRLFEDKFGILLETEHQLVTDTGKPRFYDCHIPNSNMLFEIDGSFWHSRPEAQRRDAEKDALAAQLGYRLYRIPEDKIIEFIMLFELEGEPC